MIDKKFEITGVALNTEFKNSFLFGICFIFIWITFAYLYCFVDNVNSIVQMPNYIFFGSMFLGLRLSLFFARILWKKKRVRYLFEFSEENIRIQALQGSLSYGFKYAYITVLSLGTAKGMRLFKIETNQKKYNIRLGT